MESVFRIKNMVCRRCIRVVEEETLLLGLPLLAVSLGAVRLQGQPTPILLQTWQKALEKQGFELLENPKDHLIEQVKNIVIRLIHEKNGSTKFNYSTLIANEIGKDYAYISHLFSSEESITIEKYIIWQRIEKVKQLLTYGEQTLSEIAFLMSYSSTQHLSNQFKQVTGQTPTEFKRLSSLSLLQPLDEVQKHYTK